MLVLCDVATVMGEIEGSVVFAVLVIAVGEFADEVRRIAPLGPSLAEIAADRAGRTANLTGERISFFGRKSLADLKSTHRERVSFLVNLEFFCRLNCHKSYVVAG